MQNESTRTPNVETPELPTTRRERRDTRTRKRLLMGAAAVAVVGALVGTGFTVQASIATAESVAHTEQLAALGGRDAAQLGAYSGIAAAHAKKNAADTLNVANDTIAAVDGKVDAKELQASVASLGDYETLAIDELTDRTAKTKAAVASAKAGAAEFDRKKAEEAAAAEAAAAAAAQAAAEALAQQNTPEGARAFASQLAASQYGWGADQFSCLDSLWQKESGWNYQAVNASSGATGIPQSLPGDKMATAGADWQTNAATQVTWGLGYIQAAYGTPCAAWSHSQAVNWY